MNYIHNINMKTNKINITIITSLFFFFIISILSIYATRPFLKLELQNLYIKQIIFYIIGSLLIIFTTYKGFYYLKRYHLLIYIGINILLLALLIFGIEINGSKCWFYIGPINFQPSELMKISLILTLSEIIYKFNKKKKKTTKNEFIVLLKLFFITLIPSILTFLEPDTGAVIIYLLILLIMIYFTKLNKVWYITFISIFIIFTLTFSYLYFFNQDLIIKLIGNDLFYRIDRILFWVNNSGYQLENSLIAVGSAGLFGFGYLNNTVYFPEPQTDFIFSTFTSNFGFIGALFLLFLILSFDASILSLAKKRMNLRNRYILLGIFIMLFYGQIQNISMTLGLLPITGIPLPYISYGGSSLLVFLFVVGIILNINKEINHYHN